MQGVRPPAVSFLFYMLPDLYATWISYNTDSSYIYYYCDTNINIFHEGGINYGKPEIPCKESLQ